MKGREAGFLGLWKILLSPGLELFYRKEKMIEVIMAKGHKI